MGFTKLDEGILQSSIMAESANTFKIWIAFLASCDENGMARVSPVFLASVCHLPLRMVKKAIEILEAPDVASRSTAEEGRRIRRVDGGYFVINYQKYRYLSYSKGKEAIRKREWRKRKQSEVGEGDKVGHVPNVPDCSASASVFININLKEGVWGGIQSEDMKLWNEAFPACDIKQELKKMAAWIIANPAKGKKKNYRRFITSWLSRTQEKGGTKGGLVPSGPHKKTWIEEAADRGEL